MLDEPGDGRIKMWVTTAGLRLRRDRPRLFLEGGYTPLATEGARGPQLFAFARSLEDSACIAVVPRFVSRMGEAWKDWAAGWGDTAIRLPDGGDALRQGSWRNVLTGEEHRPADGVLEAGTLLRNCPVALLVTRS
jgi:(1->4)-alpha-D-glucan 1-alpha-D-glucosylmutase